MRDNPQKVLGENPNARQNFINAGEKTLEAQFGLGSAQENQRAFEAKIDSLPVGPQQIDKRLNLNSKLGFARSISNRTVANYYRNEAKKPSWPNYSDAQKAKLAASRAPDPLQQVEHLNDLAADPKGAINVDNVYFTEGGVKGGIPKDSPHGQKNWGEPGKDLAKFENRIAASGVNTEPTNMSVAAKPTSTPKVSIAEMLVEPPPSMSPSVEPVIAGPPEWISGAGRAAGSDLLAVAKTFAPAGYYFAVIHNTSTHEASPMFVDPHFGGTAYRNQAAAGEKESIYVIAWLAHRLFGAPNPGPYDQFHLR